MSFRLLYYCPNSSGGLADYAHEQAGAFLKQGWDVGMLAAPEFFSKRSGSYDSLPLLQEAMAVDAGTSAVTRKFFTAKRYLHDFKAVADTIHGQGYRHVLLGSFVEYLAPLWAWRFRRLARQGVVFGAMVHDPVRDFQLGPAWWHRRSIAAGYSFLSEAFVHEEITLDTVDPMPRLRTTVVPHGAYVFPPATRTRSEMRRELSLPESATVLLAFGHVRDNKNLDLTIRALAQADACHLLVVGNEISGTNRPTSFYRSLAEQLGVANRVTWREGFLPATEVSNYFAAADAVMLNYSSGFRSASGVVNVAVAQRRPCVASAGGGNLCSVVQRYGLGIWVEPDDVSALVAGLKQLRKDPPQPRWDDYLRENSWEKNASLIVSRFMAHEQSGEGESLPKKPVEAGKKAEPARGKEAGSVLVYAPTDAGGVAEYVFYQACELERRGWKVKMLTAPGFLSGRKVPGKHDRCLLPVPAQKRSRFLTRMCHAKRLLANENRLAWRAWRERPTFVLCESYHEYLAPLWFLAPWFVSRWRAIPFVSDLHDPVRDFRIGPVWWHRLSIACAYSPLSVVVVHHPVPPEALVPSRVRIVQAAVGVFDVPLGRLDPADLRAGWKFPAGSRVFLALGYLRDNKNLDLVLKAMTNVPEAYLVVVGQASASHCRPFDFYRKLASELGLLERVRFYDQFVADSDLGAWLAAPDFIVLTYAASFVSQSGVVNLAAGARKPVLASSGPGPLRKAVEDFRLGVFVAPDSVSAIADGMCQLLSGKTPAPNWSGYTAYASWETNVGNMLAALPNSHKIAHA